MIINKLLNKEKINNARQQEIDLLRGFTIIIFIVCHTGLYLSANDTSFMYYFADLIGSEPAAPVFMILMGISIIYSKNHNASYYLKRGITLLTIAYLLNLFRSFIYFFTGELDYFACINGFFVVDIYQFAGLVFILFSIFKALKLKSYIVFIISIIFLVIGEILMSIPGLLEFNDNYTYILNLFLPLDNDWCCFNLLTWLIYPSFGLLFGEILIRTSNKNKLYLITLFIGLIGIVALYLNIYLRFPDYTTYYYGGNFYRMGIINSIVTILCFLFFISSWYYIGKILPKIVSNLLVYLSRNITFIYIFSWIIISILIHIQALYNLEFNGLLTIIIMILTFITCILSSLINNKLKMKIVKKRR